MNGKDFKVLRGQLRKIILVRGGTGHVANTII